MKVTRKIRLGTLAGGSAAIMLCALLAPAMAFAAKPSAPALIDVWVEDVGQVAVSFGPSIDASIPSVPGHSLTYSIYRSKLPITDANLPATPVASGLTVPGTVMITADPDEITQSYVWFYAMRATDSDAVNSNVSLTAAPDLHGYRNAANIYSCTRCHDVHGAYPDTYTYTSYRMCYECHGTTSQETPVGAKSTQNVQADFYDYASPSTAGSWHRSDTMVANGRACSACHSSHRAPYYYDASATYVPDMSYRKMLRVQTGVNAALKPTYKYYSNNVDTRTTGYMVPFALDVLVPKLAADGENSEFCFACHGADAAPIGYVGDANEYANTAGDHNSANYPTAAHGTTVVKSNDDGRTNESEYAQVQCLACHDAHGSAADKLIAYRGSDKKDATTTYSQAELCFACHSTASTESKVAAGYSAPFAWNARGVKQEFGKAATGGSSHPAAITTGISYVQVLHDTITHTTKAQFDAYGTAANLGDPGIYQTMTTTTGDGAITLATYPGTVDPPAEPWIYGNRGNATTFDGYDITSGVWNDGFNPDNHDGANGNTNFSAATASSSFWLNNKVYTTRGNGTAMDVYDPVGVGADGTTGGDWADSGVTAPNAISTGGDTAMNKTATSGECVYFLAGGTSTSQTPTTSNSKIGWWKYTPTTGTGSVNFQVGGVDIPLGNGAAIAYAPTANRLFVLNRNAAMTQSGVYNNGRLYYLANPGRPSTDADFTQGPVEANYGTTSGTNRMTCFTKNGVDYLMIIGRDTTDRFTKIVSDLGGTPTELVRFTDPFGATLADGADLEWDGGDYLYAVRGGANRGFRRIQIPGDPSVAGNWNTGSAVWSAELANPAWDATNGTWAAYSSIAVGTYDPPPYATSVYYGQGSANTGDILPTAPADHWGSVSWTENEASGYGTFTVAVQGWNGSTWTPLGAPSSTSPIDISAYAIADYAKVRLVGTFSTTNNAFTPTLFDWTMTTTGPYGVTAASLTCANCHNTHVVQRNTAGSTDPAVKGGAWELARVSDPANTKTQLSGGDGATTTAFCLECHKSVDADQKPFDAAISDTTLVPYRPVFEGFVPGTAPYFPGWDKTASGFAFTTSGHYTSSAGQKAYCKNCHDPHASDFKRLTAWTAPSGTDLVAGWTPTAGTRSNTTASVSKEEGLCYQCHGNGTIGKKATGAADVATPASPASGTNNKHVMSTYADRHIDTETAAALANRHSECTDCHDAHVAKKVGGTATQDTLNTSAPGGALYGATGVVPAYDNAVRDSTSNPGTYNWGTPASYSSLRLSGAANDMEAYLCFKCHSGNTTQPTGQTNLAQEFNPSNASSHNVLGQSIGVQSAFTTVASDNNSYTTTWAFPTANVFRAASGMDINVMLTCTSCHTNETAGQAKGPHGSSVQWLLDPNYGTVWKTSYTTTAETDGMYGTPICAKCHDLYDGTSWSNNVHSRGTDHGTATRTCIACHIKIPHGWKRPRLLGTVTDPAPYASTYVTWIRADTGHTLTSGRAQWQESDCGQTGCGQHSATTTNPTWK